MHASYIMLAISQSKKVKRVFKNGKLYSLYKVD